jgi:quinol monooxygenase YgiN
MIRHEVMFKFKGSPSVSENIAEMKRALEKLAHLVPGMLTLDIYTDVNESPNNYHLLLIADYDDQAALDAYEIHPEHQEAVKVTARIADSVAIVNYTLA